MNDQKRNRILLSLTGTYPGRWAQLLGERREVVLEPDGQTDPTITYAVVWRQPPGLLARLPNLKAIFSTGAGVDHVLADDTLPDVPIVRVVDNNLSTHMSEYVAWRVLDHHRRGREYRARQAGKHWAGLPQPTASEITVGFLGFGELARFAAAKLLSLGFTVNGWSRSGQPMADVETFAGKDGLKPFLGSTDILVVLLPLTPQTEGIVDYRLLSRLKKDGPLGGPVLINAGRGGLQRERDILRALGDGTLREASLDVFETEPLAQSSPLWTHERVFLTPHAAAESDPTHLAPPMLDQMDAHDRGEPLRNLVDRKEGY